MIFLAFAENSVQLVPDGSIFLHIALILLMIWFLNRTLFKPINRILEERERKTGGRVGDAHNILADADAKLLAYEQSLRQARTEAYAKVEEVRREALAVRQQEIDLVKTEVNEMIATEKAALQNQIAQVRKQLQADARALAERISISILKQAA